MSQIMYAGEWKDVVAAYEKGDYVTAFQGSKYLAEQGHAEAQYKLGVLYNKGHGVTQDYKEAAKWYQEACQAQLDELLYAPVEPNTYRESALVAPGQVSIRPPELVRPSACRPFYRAFGQESAPVFRPKPRGSKRRRV